MVIGLIEHLAIGMVVPLKTNLSGAAYTHLLTSANGNAAF